MGQSFTLIPNSTGGSLHPEEHDAQESAELVLDQVQRLWDDQVSLASSLVERRKTLASWLAVLIGLGLFRLELFRPSTSAPTLSDDGMYWLRVSLSMSVACFAGGTYMLFTERSLVRFFFGCLWRHLKRWVWDKDAFGDLRWLPARPTDRAISSLLLDDERLEDWQRLSPQAITNKKTERLRLAYNDLRDRNGRVKGRLRDATIGIMGGYLLVFFAFLSYLWTC